MAEGWAALTPKLSRQGWGVGGMNQGGRGQGEGEQESHMSDREDDIKALPILQPHKNS